MRKHALLVALALLVLSLPAFAQAPAIVAGQAGAAYYKAAVPPNWNGTLVIWNHGFDLNPIKPFTVDPMNPLDGLGPLAPLQFSKGYAVAASSYRQVGWALFHTKNDLQALVNVFATRFGTPAQVIVTGGSLGGAVTADAIENANIGNVVGALTVCGANAGARNWDAALDLRLVYDAVCSDVPNAAVPGGASGLPKNLPYTTAQLAAAVNACTGILTPVAFQTPAQQARLAKILAVSKIPANFLLTDMGYATFAMRDLVFDPTKLAGKVGTGNAAVFYGDQAIDAAIERVTPNPGAANRLARNFTPTGAVGAAKVLALHTSGDGLVLVENLNEYGQVVPASQYAWAVVNEQVPTHCGFTPDEIVAAWYSLEAWLAGGPKPTPFSMQGLCQFIDPQVPPDQAGNSGCRIDPTFDVPDMDGRIRPR